MKSDYEVLCAIARGILPVFPAAACNSAGKICILQNLSQSCWNQVPMHRPSFKRVLRTLTPLWFHCKRFRIIAPVLRHLCRCAQSTFFCANVHVLFDSILFITIYFFSSVEFDYLPHGTDTCFALNLLSCSIADGFHTFFVAAFLSLSPTFQTRSCFLFALSSLILKLVRFFGECCTFVSAQTLTTFNWFIVSSKP